MRTKLSVSKISIWLKLPLVELPDLVETIKFIISSMYCLGTMFMFEISTMEEKHSSAFEGMKIARRGKCTITCRVVISIHSFFNDTPRITDKKMLVEIAPEIAELAVDATLVKAFVAAAIEVR